MREIVNKETEKNSSKRVEKKYFPHVFLLPSIRQKGPVDLFLVIVHIWGIRKIELDAANGFLFTEKYAPIFFSR